MVERGAAFAHSRNFTTKIRIFTLLTCLIVKGYCAEELTEDKYYTNGWAIKLTEPGGQEKAQEIAKRHGFEKVTKVREIITFCLYISRTRAAQRVPVLCLESKEQSQ